MTNYDLSDQKQVLLYLANTSFASETVTPLSGGTGNYVYRLKLRTPYGGRPTLVLKHGKPYIPGRRDWAFALERQLFEVEAVTRVHAWLPPDSKVVVAAVHLFDKDLNVIIMDDCGEKVVDLKKLMAENPPDPSIASEIGAVIGEFLGRLHLWGKGDEVALRFFDANQQARQLSAFVTYGRLVSTVTAKDALPKLLDPPFEVSAEEIQKISEISKQRIQEINTSRETVTMGDFWTGNMLVDVDEVGRQLRKVTVVDWELVKPGLAALDVGQFHAEMELLRHFHPSCRESASSLCRAFFENYGRRYSVDTALIKKAADHVGAHLIAWTPRVEWGGREETQKVVRKGIKYIMEADKMQKLEDLIITSM